MKTKKTIKQALRNIAFVGLYAAGFGVVFTFGIFAMNGSLENSVSVEKSDEAPQEEILTVYGIEIDESPLSQSKQEKQRI